MGLAKTCPGDVRYRALLYRLEGVLEGGELLGSDKRAKGSTGSKSSSKAEAWPTADVGIMWDCSNSFVR